VETPTNPRYAHLVPAMGRKDHQIAREAGEIQREHPEALVMKDIVLGILRLVAQWSTILPSVAFRDQFSGGGILRSMGGPMVVLGLTLGPE
jgi:hypothetical protein